MRGVSDEYLGIWIDQAERQKRRAPFDGVTVDLDEWLAILLELRDHRLVGRRDNARENDIRRLADVIRGYMERNETPPRDTTKQLVDLLLEKY